MTGIQSFSPSQEVTTLEPLTYHLLEMLAIVLIGAALTYTFGRMIGDTRQGWAVLAVAGSLAAKKRVPVSDGTMPTHGPIVEHIMLWSAP